MPLPKAQAHKERLDCTALRNHLDQIDWTRVPQHIRVELTLLQTELANWRPLRDIVLDVQHLAYAADQATNN